MRPDKQGTQFLVFVPIGRDFKDGAVLQALKRHLRIHLPELTFYVSYEADIAKVPRGPGEYRVFLLENHKSNALGVEFRVSTEPFKNRALERLIYKALHSFVASHHRRTH
jgi:hypothetical protein